MSKERSVEEKMTVRPGNFIMRLARQTMPTMSKPHDPPPPVFGTWGRFYALVIANTLLVYLLLVVFSTYAR